jgi:hypothetical protein
MGGFFYRVFGAAVLDAGTYEGIESDPRSTGQAAAVVVLSSLAAGIGVGGWQGPGAVTFVAFTTVALVTWLAWAMLTFQIGSRWLPGPRTRTSPGELIRTVGFASAPGLLQAAAAFPQVTVPVFLAAWAWMFAAMVVAVKHALDYESLGRAIAVCAVAAFVAFSVALVVGIALTERVS